MDQNKIGKYIEKLRKEKGYTQKELASKLGLSNTAISKWECGNNLPDISILEPLCNVLGVDILDLIHCENNKKQTKNKISRKAIIIISIIILLIISCITLSYFYIRRKNQTGETTSDYVRVYKIASADDNFSVDGFLMFNNNQSIVLLNYVRYQGEATGTDDEQYAKSLSYYLKIHNKTVLKYNMSNNENNYYKISELLKNTNNRQTIIYNSEVKLSTVEEYFDESFLKINYYDKKENFSIINIKLKLSNIFT